MAVIKIVPMPGAVGDKGDEGAPGPQGQQGEQGVQGAPGADALWNYNGEYNPGAGYAVGDVVTFEGQTWYRKNSNGGNVGDTPSEGLFWDLVAAKGADSIAPTSGTWDTRFGEISEIVDETPNSENWNYGRYYCVGDLVFFEINLLITQPSSWGNTEDARFSGVLPFPLKDSIHSNTLVRNYTSGVMQAVSDEEPFGFPYQENEFGNFNITVMMYNAVNDTPGVSAGTPLFSLYAVDAESLNTTSENLKLVTPDWPINLRVPNNLTSPRVTIRFSGTYLKQ
jgi:hypothetical protein